MCLTEHVRGGAQTIQLINVINVCIHFTGVKIKYSIIIIKYNIQYITCGI